MRPRTACLAAVVAAGLLAVLLAESRSHSWNADMFPHGLWNDGDHWYPPGVVPGSQFPAETAVSIQAPLPPSEEGSEVTITDPVTVNVISIGPPNLGGKRNKLIVLAPLTLTDIPSGANTYLTTQGDVIVASQITGSGRAPLLLGGEGGVVTLAGGTLTGSIDNHLLIDGYGYTQVGTLRNQGVVMASDGKTLVVYQSVLNQLLGKLTTDGNPDAPSTLKLAGQYVEAGLIEPTAAGRVVLSGTTLCRVTVSNGVAEFDTAGAKFEDRVTILDGASVSGKGGYSLELLDNTTVYNAGVIALENPTDFVGILLNDKSSSEGGTATLTGPGVLTLAGPKATVKAGPRSTLTNDAGHAIRGFGIIAGPTNRGLILASNGTLEVSGVKNAGTLESAGNGVLLFTNGVTEPAAGGINRIINKGGPIRLGVFSTVKDARWEGGPVDVLTVAYGDAPMLAGTNHFTAGSSLNVPNGTTLVFPGTDTIQNDSVIQVTGSGTLKSGYLYSTDPRVTRFSGTGMLVTTPVGSSVPQFSCHDTCTFVNDAGHTIAGPLSLNAPLENHGTLMAENGYLTVSRPLTGSGGLIVKGNGYLQIMNAAIQAGNMEMDAGARLSNVLNKKITLSGSLRLRQTDETTWTAFPELTMAGISAGQSLEVIGSDLGPTWSGFAASNFLFKSLTVTGSGTWVTLVDVFDNGNRGASGREALYVNYLYVNPGATLNLNGLKIYTLASGESNPHLVVAGDGSKFGGGTIVDESANPAPTFTDPTLQPGTTAVKAIHITELRTAIDTLRARHSLPAYSWTDAGPPAGTPIRGTHLAELRTALNAAYTAAGRTPPAYTDPSIRSSLPVKAVHITEIREAILALW